MKRRTYTVEFPGAILHRGFWLYVWRVSTPVGQLLYVGRTGDNSSPRATPPYQRMGQHLGHVETQNALRKHLERRGVDPTACQRFEMIAHGPIFPEAENMQSHLNPRDVVGAMEKTLADELAAAGYRVLNQVRWTKPLNARLWRRIRTAFAVHFRGLKRAAEHRGRT